MDLEVRHEGDTLARFTLDLPPAPGAYAILNGEPVAECTDGGEWRPLLAPSAGAGDDDSSSRLSGGVASGELDRHPRGEPSGRLTPTETTPPEGAAPSSDDAWLLSTAADRTTVAALRP